MHAFVGISSLTSSLPDPSRAHQQSGPVNPQGLVLEAAPLPDEPGSGDKALPVLWWLASGLPCSHTV
eukprot:1160447-Pelagomonas_calceolata.AAC.7